MKGEKPLSPREFKRTIQNGVSLVDFTAPWCAPCRVQAPIVQKVAEQLKGRAMVVELNIDENRETAVKLGIRSIPTLILFKNGDEIQRFVGLQAMDTLLSAVEKMLN